MLKMETQSLKDAISSMSRDIPVFATRAKDTDIEIKQHCRQVQGVSGVIRFKASPWFSLTLCTADSIILLTLVNSTEHLCQWITSVNRTVNISSLTVIQEEYTHTVYNQSFKIENALVSWTDVSFVDGDSSSDGFLPSAEAKAIFCSPHTCLIMVHHVSPPFYHLANNQNTACCLVYISYCSDYEYKLWLILKDDQVAFWQFLAPNREYLIVFPKSLSRDHFDTSKQSLKDIFKEPNKEMKDIFHHQDFFFKSIFDAAELPAGSKLYIKENNRFSNMVIQNHREPLSTWFSLAEADSSDMGLTTFYGLLSAVLYDKDFVSSNCFLCTRCPPAQPALTQSKAPQVDKWTNPWTSTLTIGERQLMELPVPEAGGQTPTRTGVPGNLSQVLKLLDPVSGKDRSVYFKHSYLTRVGQLPRLTTGTTLCVTHLIRRKSARGRVYYIATMLTRVWVLEMPDEYSKHASEDWGAYGLQFKTPYDDDKRWGLLSSWQITKVGMVARCKICNSICKSGQCEQNVAHRGHTTYPYANVYINVHIGKALQKVKLVINNHKFVQMLLKVPDTEWDDLLTAAVNEDLYASAIKNTQDPTAVETTGPLKQIFETYFDECRRSKDMYFFSIKRKKTSEKLQEYMCIHLEPYNELRMAIVMTAMNTLSSTNNIPPPT